MLRFSRKLQAFFFGSKDEIFPFLAGKYYPVTKMLARNPRKAPPAGGGGGGGRRRWVHIPGG